MTTAVSAGYSKGPAAVSSASASASAPQPASRISVAPSVSYKSLVDRSFNQIRQNARTIPAVTIRVVETIARVGERESASRKRILLGQLSAISEQIAAVDSACDRDDLSDRIARAREALEATPLDPNQPSREAIKRHHKRLEELRDES